jgi:hypothetical protein
LMHATPGDMKSFRSSAERMALMEGVEGAPRATHSVGVGFKYASWDAVLSKGL